VTALELDHHMLAAETLAGKHAPKRIGRPNLRQNRDAFPLLQVRLCAKCCCGIS
jgi:hypothetical protein